MDLFRHLAGAAATVLALCFLLYSRFTPGKAEKWRFFLCLLGCGVLFCVDLHWAVQSGIAFACGVVLAWYVGSAKLFTAAAFGLLFGGLRVAALLLSFGAAQIIPGADMVLTEVTILYALTACAAVFGAKWRDTPIPMLQFVPVWLVCVILCGEIIRTGGWREVAVLELLAYLWLVYAGVALLRVGERMEMKRQEVLAQQQKAHLYALQEEYYQELRSKQTETRALWHDLNKYLRAAKAEAAPTQALEQLGMMLDRSMEIVDVGNPVLNVILNEYAQTAKAAGIELRMKVQVPQKLGVTAADLYVVIGNTMDNAIEACKILPAEQRQIDMILRTHHDVLYYKLTNPCTPQRQNRPADPLHGYGLDNVQRCVDQYNGSTEISRDNGFFTITIHLNQNLEGAMTNRR